MGLTLPGGASSLFRTSYPRYAIALRSIHQYLPQLSYYLAWQASTNILATAVKRK